MAKQATAVSSRSTRTAPRARQRRTIVETSKVQWSIPFGTKNWLFLGIGVAAIVVGYLMMSTAISPDPTNNDGIWNSNLAVNIAPLFLLVGYCVLIPYGIFYRDKRTASDGADISAN